MALNLISTAPPTSRLLGVLGVIGGAVLLVAYLPFQVFDGATNVFRLTLFNLGSIAVVIAIDRLPGTRRTRVSTAVAAATVLANAWYPAMVLLSIGRPIANDAFALAFFWAAVAMWLTDAAFGFAALAAGSVTRWGALALGVGSLLAFLGIDRLGLVSPGDPTSLLFRLALFGVALNGFGWILLGGDVALGRRGDD
jgi:hypothetical protein